jgi:hypothetical protein
MEDDPNLYALRDRISHACALGIVMTALAARSI